MNPALLSVKQAAAYAGYSTKTIRRMIAGGGLTVLRSSPRGAIRIKVEDLERALAANGQSKEVHDVYAFIRKQTGR